MNTKIYVALNGNKDTGFADIILTDNEIKALQTTPGIFTATKDEGLISQPDDYSTSYYFRGNVDNNYVSFAGYTWRIVRISGNNTIKLVLDTAIESNLKIFSNNDYVENSNYMAKGDFSDSLVLSDLKDWYDENLKKYDNYIANTKFCISSSSLVNEAGYKYYTPYSTIFRGINDEVYGSDAVCERCCIGIIIPRYFQTQCLGDGAQRHQRAAVFIDKRFGICPCDRCAVYGHVDICRKGGGTHTNCQ